MQKNSVNVNPAHFPDIQQLQKLATRLFTDGQYTEADQVLATLAELTERERTQIALRRAQIGMLSDQMDHVEKQLNIARNEYGAHVYFVKLQADLAIRKGDLAAAAEAFRLLNRHPRARHLLEFDGEWYRTEKLSRQYIDLDNNHALPIFDVSINGHSGRFVLDTGTGDCLLNTAFAQSAGVEYNHFEEAAFAGGRVGHWQLGRIDQMSIGDSCFSELPAMVAPLEHAFSQGFSNGGVDGIIGANLLRAAGGIDIDYQNRRFVLGSPGLETGEALWIAGTHYPLTSCRVGDAPPSSWFIDSGMSGVDLACSESAARRHDAKMLRKVIEAHGGGGKLSAKALQISRFRHADLEYESLPAAIIPKFNLGKELGIRIGGIIGHDWLAKHRVQMDYRSMQVQIHH